MREKSNLHVSIASKEIYTPDPLTIQNINNLVRGLEIDFEKVIDDRVIYNWEDIS